MIEDSIRSESEIIQIKSDLAELTALQEKYSELKASVIESHETCESNANAIALYTTDIENSAALTQEKIELASKTAEKIEQHHDNCESYIEQIEDTQNQTQAQETLYDSNILKTKELIFDLEKNNTLVKEQQENLNSQLATATSQQEKIESIISDANRASMAGSFKTAKDELDKPIRNAEVMMSVTLIGMAVVSFYMLNDSGFGSGDFNPIEFLLKLTVITPLIWIAWSNAKKLGYLIRIRTDYGYKYASAMAYEGYRKQAENVNDETMLKRLLHLAIEHMGNNPIRLYDTKTNHASPMHEFSDSVKDMVKPVKDSLKKNIVTNKATDEAAD